MTDAGNIFALLAWPLAVLLGAAAGWGVAVGGVDQPPPWAVMWGVCIGMFLALKLMTMTEHRRWQPTTAAGYLLGWPGMDPQAFATRGAAQPVSTAQWSGAWLKLATGAVLVWVLVRPIAEVDAWAAGWVGMVGMVMVLHFGLFDLLALGWRRIGRPVQRVMREPLSATSLGAFWGRRWNGAFSDVARRWGFEPMTQALGPRLATGWVFAVSGLAHELAISLPAGGGWGGPGGYFLLQWVGVVAERSSLGRAAGLRRGWRGRLWTWAVAAGGLGLLFHGRFVVDVIVPWLELIRAM